MGKDNSGPQGGASGGVVRSHDEIQASQDECLWEKLESHWTPGFIAWAPKRSELKMKLVPNLVHNSIYNTKLKLKHGN